MNNYLSEFSTILNFFDPEIAHHLRSIGAYADSYALPWFMSLFAENTSVEQLYLIWDSLLVQPKLYIKFLAAMIIHNVRERLLGRWAAQRRRHLGREHGHLVPLVRHGLAQRALAHVPDHARVQHLVGAAERARGGAQARPGAGTGGRGGAGRPRRAQAGGGL